MSAVLPDNIQELETSARLYETNTSIPMPTRFNHSPFVTGVWVPFNGQRFKDPYMIKLKTGETFEAFPNGGAWACKNGVWYEDDAVAEVMLLPDGLGPRRGFTGAYRIQRNVEMFGKRYPIYIQSTRTFIKEEDIPEDKRILPLVAYAYVPSVEEGQHVRAHVMIAVGELVDLDDPRPGLDELDTVASFPGLLCPDETRVIIGNDYFIQGIQNFSNWFHTEPSLRLDLVKLCQEHGVKKRHYIPQVAMLGEKLMGYMEAGDEKEEALKKVSAYLEEVMVLERANDKRGLYPTIEKGYIDEINKSISPGEFFNPIWETVEHMAVNKANVCVLA